MKTKGKWIVMLITPDRKIIRKPRDLKIYIAKSGAVIDANLINFSIPRRTAKVDKKLNSAPKTEEKSVEKSPQSELEPTTPQKQNKTPPTTPKGLASPPASTDAKNSGTKRTYNKNPNPIPIPRSSRREIKVPQKFRDQSPEEKPSSPKKKPVEKALKKTEKASRESIEVHQEPTDNIDISSASIDITVTDEDMEKAILQETTMAVAVKSRPNMASSKSIKELVSLGAGTFSIDEDTAKNMASGRFTKKVKVRRCHKCKGCRTKNCQNCLNCKDMVKYGGPGQLKKPCELRRCENPSTKDGVVVKVAHPVEAEVKQVDILEAITNAEIVLDKEASDR